MRSRSILLTCLWLMMPFPAWAGHGAVDSLTVAPFGKVWLYAASPHPSRVVLFVSGDGGWNKGVVDMAHSLSEMDALVVGIDITRYLHALEESGSACLYPAADFENLSKAVQQHRGYPSYVIPILVGYSSGATLVYAVLVQAPGTTFRGGLSLGFCPDLEVHKPFCKGSGLEYKLLPKGKGYWFLPASTLEDPWIALQGMIDQVCFPESTIAFVGRVPHGEVVTLPKVGHGYSVYARWMPQFKESFGKLVAAPPSDSAATVAPDLPDLPLEVVDATGAESETDIMALHITGDGGWGVTDKGLSRSLAEQGIPVVALNSLHYFWKARTPEGTAQDVARLLHAYLDRWKKKRVVLIGYSFGADVLPFVINRLPEDLRKRIELAVFLGLSSSADFQFHLTDWIGGSGKHALQVRPEMEKLRGLKMVCFYGSKESDALCKELPSDLVRSIELPGGHRIGGDFQEISREILDQTH